MSKLFSEEHDSSPTRDARSLATSSPADFGFHFIKPPRLNGMLSEHPGAALRYAKEQNCGK
ncbi:MAG: hypothetical protein HC767_14980 [Akkermansiaceae bacterium]|nr:hypothetical protein [Akkermansiaceae bacterium]